MDNKIKAHFHLPGLFEFNDLYYLFLKLYQENREYFYDWCDIGSIYGAPKDCLWSGGRVGFGEREASKVLELMEKLGISARLTFSNSLVSHEHLRDGLCNSLCKDFEERGNNGVITASDILEKYLADKYPGLYLVSSTTKVITEFDKLVEELNQEKYRYVVPDFRLNTELDKLSKLNRSQKSKVEFLCNECCDYNCKKRKNCYESVSKKSLGLMDNHICTAPNSERGYVFSEAMKNKAFIGIDAIKNIYLPLGFTNYKLEGRGLGSALVLEILLYYMIKPECQLLVREAIYLDYFLDLF